MYDPRTLSILMHAHSKVGKSTLAMTAPKPIITFDAEGGTKFLMASPALYAKYGRHLRIIQWDPKQPPPRADGTWDVAVVTVSQWQDVVDAYNWLASAQHDFVTVDVDSITEIQRRLKKNLVGTEQMKMQDWGTLLMVMDDVIRGIRDLANNPYNPIRVALFVAETRQGGDGKWRPYMQGQISTALPYWMDIVGYLYTEMAQDAQGQFTIPVRKLLVSQHPMFEAGERVQGLVGPVIDEPDISDILNRVYPQYAYLDQPQPTQQEMTA